MRNSLRLNAPKEWQEQVSLMQWVQLRTPQEPRLALLFHIPNGEHRDKRTGAKLKRMGVRRGVSDLFLPVPIHHDDSWTQSARQYHGLWIELKRVDGANDVTDEEWAWIGAMTSQGYCTMVCTGWVDAAQRICWYLHREQLAEDL